MTIIKGSIFKSVDFYLPIRQLASRLPYECLQSHLELFTQARMLAAAECLHFINLLARTCTGRAKLEERDSLPPPKKTNKGQAGYSWSTLTVLGSTRSNTVGTSVGASCKQKSLCSCCWIWSEQA